MIHRAAIEGARAPQPPVRSLLALALLLAIAPAWAQQSTAPTPSDTPAPATDPMSPHAAAPTAQDAVATPADEPLSPATAPPTAPEPAAQDAPVPPASDVPPTQAEPPTAAATGEPPASTAAESDFDSLYGNAGDEPDSRATSIPDPWEPYNRRMHRFNNAVDRHVAKPLATLYVKVVPRPVRSGVSNFFSNLGQPITAVNSLLQGKPRQAAHSLGRFVMNSTLGIGGIFDPATDAKLQNRNEDFGQTLGVWGWKRSRYVELPLFGPRTLRDVVGMVGDAPLSPLRQVQSDKVRAPLQGLQLVDLRATLMSTDALREGAQDDYRLVRDAWLQRRAYQIDGDSADDATPDYLKDDRPMVPVNAMPVSGGR